jgi:hypothetical protein
LTPLILVTIGVILVGTPLAFAATVYFWRLYFQERSGLKLVLAGKATAATVAGVLLSIPTVFYVLGQPPPFAGTLILLAIDILLPTASIAAVYLWLQDR